jgi:hypothetical protein
MLTACTSVSSKACEDTLSNDLGESFDSLRFDSLYMMLRVDIRKERLILTANKRNAMLVYSYLAGRKTRKLCSVPAAIWGAMDVF